MIVYGDAPRPADPKRVLADIAQGIGALSSASPGIARHGALAALLVAAGELAQGFADAQFESEGVDARTPLGDAAMDLAVALARALVRSWRSEFADDGGLEPAASAAAALAGLDMPANVTLKTAEGFSFYAVYPELYAAAAAALQGQPTRVVGLRSIGTTLAAVLAAALDTPTPATVRPIGSPFDRRLRLAPDLTAELRQSDRVFAIADEGPGLSGSSFAAALDAIEASGPARVHAFPSHAGEPGGEANEARRRRWRATPRHVVPFEREFLEREGPRGLARWFEDLVGPPVAPLGDLSGGAWRRWRFADEAGWPPVNPWQERRKYRLDTESGAYLLKFSGLGASGEAKWGAARRLAEAGFANPPIAFRHGFLLEPWREDLRPLDLRRVDRSAFVERLGAYLGFRCRAFPAESWRGATPDALFDMARVNIAEALGPLVATRIEGWAAKLPALARATSRVEIDGRLHAWEWLAGETLLLKADALDHHAAHDLVGCQDIAWDVAGAVVEFALNAGEEAGLRALVERQSGRAPDPDLLAFCALCYPAFQLGAFTMAAAGQAGSPEESRLRARAQLYADVLRARLA